MEYKSPRFLYSPLVIILFGVLTFAAFAFSMELLFYGFVALFALYVIGFCSDLAPIMPLFLLCYVTSSPSNNPGRTETGLFNGTSGAIILCLAAVVVIALALRITFDEKIGWRQFLEKPRMLLGGMLALGAVYLLSGIGSKGYTEDALRNIVFALIQFASVFLLYYIFSATVDWENFDIDYFAWAGLVPGLVVLAELVWFYLTQDILWGGEIVIRFRIYTGWGNYNNMGAIIASSIPFAFYFAQKKKHNSIYLILAVVLAFGVVLSCSRSSMVFAVLVALLSYIYTFIRTENKLEFGITSASLLVLLGVLVIVFWDKASLVFREVPSIADMVDGSLTFDSNGRFDMYKRGIEIFLQNPILGDGFFFRDYKLMGFSTVENFSNFFPGRLHNTIIQMLASCGAIGLLAYAYHRWQTIRLLVNRWSVEKAYIGVYLFALLGMSLLDCHFFNVGPTLFYSMALAVLEFAEEQRGVYGS